MHYYGRAETKTTSIPQLGRMKGNTMPHEREWRDNLHHNLRCIRDVMNERGLTSLTIANDLGVHPSLMNKILEGTHSPPLFLTLMLADYLGLPYYMGKFHRAH